eukprot:evm.model.scf_1037.6 EVM.evm.TU.scf_1037.6   scf_1037:37740-40118(-)
MKSALVQTTLGAPKAQVARAARPSVCSVRASREDSSSRREALALMAAVATGASLTLAEKAIAVTIPSQASTGGLGRENGGRSAVAKSSTYASASGYKMEGTKKYGISPKRKAEVLAEVPR